MQYKSFFARMRPVIVLIAFVAPMALYAGMMRANFLLERSIGMMVAVGEGTFVTPFQYRFIMPWLMGQVAALLSTQPSRLLIQHYESLMAFLIPLALYAYLFRICKNNSLALFFALGYFYLYPFLFIYHPMTRHYYPSDSAGILLFTLGLFFLCGRQYWQFYVVLAIGLFNRETIAFLSLVFAFSQYGRMERRPFALHIFAQIMLVVAVKLWLFYIFRNNTGAGMISLSNDTLLGGLPSSMESSRIYTNIMFFTQFNNFVYMISFMGFLWLPLIFLWKKIDNEFVYRTLYATPIFIGGMFLVAYFMEFRVFGELVPIFLSATCCIAARAMMGAQNPP